MQSQLISQSQNFRAPFVKGLKNKWVDLKLRRFQPKVRFQLPVKKYCIKTVDSPFELKEVLRLRKKIFFTEGFAQENFELYDFDKYDLLGDHIILKNQNTGQIVGTYRIMCSNFTNEFYSQNEFDIQNFLLEPGVKIELGRACIDPHHRNGATIALIWKGLAKFATLVNAKYMFGCASIDTLNSHLAHEVMRELDRQGHLDLSYEIEVQSQFSSGRINYNPGLLTSENINNAIPPLLKSYIQAGAKVLAGPAFDEPFQCSDVFTALNLTTMNEKYRARYF